MALGVVLCCRWVEWDIQGEGKGRESEGRFPTDAEKKNKGLGRVE